MDPTVKSRNDTTHTCSEWIRSCLRNHQICRNIRQRSADLNLPRPSRLLRLLHPQSPIVRLVTVRDDQPYDYITLSHRWGDPEPYKLSRLADRPGRYSIASLEAGIPVSNLPKTFQDALDITGACGYEYLWIDSLCIVQDKDLNGRNLDWEAEASNVGGIYARAIFNIAATDNKNSKGGLFSKRQGIRVPFIKDNRSLSAENDHWNAFQSNRSTQSTLLVGTFDIIESDDWGVMRSELVSRGWVTQELLLASANLLCTADQMQWSCPMSSCSELFPLGQPVLPRNQEEFEQINRPLEIDALRALKAAVVVEGDSASSDPIAAWVKLLHFYSRTSVTYAGDRVAAIRGIAQTFRSIHPETLRDAEYHSGVWSTDISRQLLWVNAQNYFTRTRPDPEPFSSNPFCLPSWSPLSYGPNTETLDIPYYGRQYLDSDPSDDILVSHARIDTSNLDPLGRAHTQENCMMTLRGALVELTCDQVPQEQDLRPRWHPVKYPAEKVLVEFDYSKASSRGFLPPALLDIISVHALVLEFSPRGMLGLLLRPHKGLSSLDGPIRWSRVGVMCMRPEVDWMGSAEWPWRRYYDAFEIRRHGFDWEVENTDVTEDNKIRWRRRQVGTPDLEDLNLV